MSILKSTHITLRESNRYLETVGGSLASRMAGQRVLWGLAKAASVLEVVDTCSFATILRIR